MCKTIKQRVRFAASPAEVYRVLANSVEHARLTGRRATIGRRAGDAFSLDGGRISGRLVDLAPGERIVQAWRTREFPEGVFSMAALVLAPTARGGTELVLTHRGVPKALIPGVEAAWKKNYWARMKKHFQR